MKKLVNDPNNVVEEMLEGLTISSPSLKLLKGANVIVRADCKTTEVCAPNSSSYKDIASIYCFYVVCNVVNMKKVHSKVALISGGGSGHEPAHAGMTV